MASTFEALLLAQTNFELNRPQFSIFQGTGQSIGNSSFTAINFDSSSVDTYNGHSNSTNNSRYTAQVAGTYLISGGTGWAANATGGRGGSIYKNGSSPTGATVIVGTNTTAGGVTVVSMPAVLVQLNVGDYVELQAFQSISSGSLSTNGGGQFCSYMYGWWMHA